VDVARKSRIGLRSGSFRSASANSCGLKKLYATTSLAVDLQAN
jgi:hypothetical protein